MLRELRRFTFLSEGRRQAQKSEEREARLSKYPPRDHDDQRGAVLVLWRGNGASSEDGPLVGWRNRASAFGRDCQGLAATQMDENWLAIAAFGLRRELFLVVES